MAGPASKLFYKIGEVSRLAGVEVYVLRYWESEFRQLSPRKNRGGQRVYTQRDLGLVLRLKRMLHDEGYTIAGAKKKLAEQPGNPPQSPFDKGGSRRQGDLATSELADALGSVKDELKDILKIIKD